MQLQGLVAGDEAGPVSVSNPPDLSRFKQVVDQKSTVSSAPFTLTPPTTDNYVFMDEFAWALNQKFSGMNIFGTNPARPTFVSLDNEPELWNSTHLEVQGPNPVTSDDYIAKTITLTEALKNQFPNMLIFGPVHYGFQGIYNWQGELNATPTGANWFPDKYLTAISAASATYGKRWSTSTISTGTPKNTIRTARAASTHRNHAHRRAGAAHRAEPARPLGSHLHAIPPTAIPGSTKNSATLRSTSSAACNPK